MPCVKSAEAQGGTLPFSFQGTKAQIDQSVVKEVDLGSLLFWYWCSANGIRDGLLVHALKCLDVLANSHHMSLTGGFAEPLEKAVLVGHPLENSGKRLRPAGIEDKAIDVFLDDFGKGSEMGSQYGNAASQDLTWDLWPSLWHYRGNDGTVNLA